MNFPWALALDDNDKPISLTAFVVWVLFVVSVVVAGSLLFLFFMVELTQFDLLSRGLYIGG